MTCYEILRPKCPLMPSENLSLYFASLTNRARRPLLIQRWKESQALLSLLFVSTFAGVIRKNLYFFCRCLELINQTFLKASRPNCNSFFRPKKMNSLYLFIVERIKAEISLNRILFLKKTAPLRIMERAS